MEDNGETDDADDEDEELHQDKKQSSHGRLRDFSGVEKNILNWAGRAFQVIMVVSGMYESDVDKVDERRVEAWLMGLEKYGKSESAYPLGMAHIQNMNDHLVTWRTHALNHIRDKVAAIYFLEHIEMTPTELGNHIKQLKASGLHTKPGSDPGYGFKSDLGVQFAEQFKKPTAELICFFCTMLQFVIEECENGKTGSKDLDFDEQRRVYNTHLTSHAIWLKIAEERWDFIQNQLFLCVFQNSGAHELALPIDEQSILKGKDLRPDVPTEKEKADWKQEMAELQAKAHGALEGWGPDDETSDRDGRNDNGERDQAPHERLTGNMIATMGTTTVGKTTKVRTTTTAEITEIAETIANIVTTMVGAVSARNLNAIMTTMIISKTARDMTSAAIVPMATM
ncbi:hypothetical protein FRC11_009755, partial [Ceratobasidium sp. 423]